MGLACPATMCTLVQAANWTQRWVGEIVRRVGANLEISKTRHLQDLKGLKVISPGVSGDILLAETIFAYNSRIRRDTRLSYFQLVTGKQSEPPPIDDTGERTHSSINRLKHLGVQVQDTESGDPQEVTNQHTPPSLIACSVGLRFIR